MRSGNLNHILMAVALGVLAATRLGCASSSSEGSSHASANDSAQAVPPSTSSSPDAETGMAGVWEGTTLASCAAFTYITSRCDAEQKVTITLLAGPHGKMTGRYMCAYGNMDCYDANYTGKVIDAGMEGARMSIRVMMPDATSCIYTGINTNETINGGYTCYQGGGLIEEGSWRARRSY